MLSWLFGTGDVAGFTPVILFLGFLLLVGSFFCFLIWGHYSGINVEGHEETKAYLGDAKRLFFLAILCFISGTYFLLIFLVLILGKIIFDLEKYYQGLNAKLKSQKRKRKNDE